MANMISQHVKQSLTVICPQMCCDFKSKYIIYSLFLMLIRNKMKYKKFLEKYLEHKSHIRALKEILHGYGK